MWPHVAARWSCRGCRGRGRVPLGLQQVPHRLSVRWILDTVMMAVQLLLSRRCWLVLALASFPRCGRACLLANTAVGVELPAPVPLALLCASCALVRQCRCGRSRSGCRRRRGAKRGAPKWGALQRQRRRHARLPSGAVVPEWLGVCVGAGVCVEMRGHFSTLVHQQFARDEGFASVGPCEPTSLTRSSSVDSGGAGPWDPPNQVCSLVSGRLVSSGRLCSGVEPACNAWEF